MAADHLRVYEEAAATKTTGSEHKVRSAYLSGRKS
jgi:hypothetical protein